MSLAPGTKLGPYEILSPLGAGGMGEVYKARDTRLGRDVAVKVLPEGFGDSPDRMRRFEREAKTLAALSHPNVLAIFDVGAHEGQPYVVMELLEGQSLREVMGGGPLSVRRSVEIGAQIAKGLAAAHAKGVIHRDLKPGNVFVTKDGQVKVLDFGLARSEVRPAPQHSRLSQEATAEAPTGPGVVLGTVGYMAPEQVRGEVADARSDIFSFGIVLYEMLSGKRPFERGTSAETMTAILKEDPPELARADVPLPPALVRMVAHCLEKSPDARFQSAKDVSFALETLSGSAGAISGVATAVPTAPGRVVISRRNLVLGGACAVLVLAAAVTATHLLDLRTQKPSQPVFRQLTFRRGAMGSARFSAEGTEIYYSAEWDGKPRDLFSVRPGNPESRSLGFGPADVLGVFQNGDLLIRDKEGSLAVAPVNGGAPRAILEGFIDADAGPDAQHVCVVRSEAGANRLEYPLGKVLYQTPKGLGRPHLSHKRDRIAFSEDSDLMVVDMAGKVTCLTKGWPMFYGYAWAPSDDEVWFSGSRQGGACSVYAVTLGGRERVIYSSMGELFLWDVSADGRLLLHRQTTRYGFAVGATKTGEERDLSWFDHSNLNALSPDGSLVVFHEGARNVGTVTDIGAKKALYMRSTDGSPAVKLGEGVGCDLSPDGQWVLALVPGEKNNHYQLVPTGAGQPRDLPDDGMVHRGGRWMPDGKRFVFRGSEPGRKQRLWIQSVEGGAPKPLTPEGSYLPSLAVSPDGRDLAYCDLERQAVCLISTEGGNPRPLVEHAVGSPITFSPDGKALLAFQGSSIVRVDLATGQRKLVREIKPADPAGFFFWNLAITPDEKTYAYCYFRELSELYVAEGLK